MTPHEQEAASAALNIPLIHAPVPPEARFREGQHPWLYSAVLGNGRVLACLDETGSLAQLFYPCIDVGPHIHSFLSGIQVLPESSSGKFSEGEEEDAEVVWLAGRGWTHELSYVEDAAVVRCVSTHSLLNIQVRQEMFVHHAHDILLNEISLINLGARGGVYRLVVYAGFDLDARENRNTCYFDVSTSMLTFFAQTRYVAVTGEKPVHSFGCEKVSPGGSDDFFRNIHHGRFNGSMYAIGQVRGSVCYDLGPLAPGETTTCQVRLCLGNSLDELVRLSTLVVQPRIHAEETIAWWRERYATAGSHISSAVIKSIYKRSLITLKLLTDQTGAIIAAPECDKDFIGCGGYGFCWPRDGAIIASTLDRLKQHEHARTFYDWALRVQEASGCWYQRYYTDGALAPTWGLVQFDQIGAIVWAICQHIKLTGDLAYGQKVYAQLALACNYMQQALDTQTGLAPITKDLWEERDAISTYACGCTWAAFHSFAHLTSELGRAAETERWTEEARCLKEAIGKHLWSASEQRFLRGLKIQTIPASGEQGHYMLLPDTTIDVSVLGLSVPFGVFPASDPRMLATAEAISRHLTSPVGGIYRYHGDTYRGGNPWIIGTLWLALQYMESGQGEKWNLLYNWALEHRTTLDLFPEQIDQMRGKPCWVNPLGWSHAMFLLATEEAIQYGLL